MTKEGGKIIDGSEIFDKAQKRADTERVADAVKEALGAETVDPKEFFDSIQEVRDAPVLPFVLAAQNVVARIRPGLFKKEGISLDNVEKRIQDMYNDEAEEAVLYAFKQQLKHVVYFLETNPNEAELQNTLKSLKKLLVGKWRE